MSAFSEEFVSCCKRYGYEWSEDYHKDDWNSVYYTNYDVLIPGYTFAESSELKVEAFTCSVLEDHDYKYYGGLATDLAISSKKQDVYTRIKEIFENEVLLCPDAQETNELDLYEEKRISISYFIR